MVDYKDRLAQAMRAADVDAHALAKAIKFTYTGVMKALKGGDKGTSAMTAANNSRAARFLCVDPDWLATGEGQMRSEKVWPFADAITPEAFFSIDPRVVQSAVDMLQAEMRRNSEKSHGKAHGGVHKNDEVSAKSLVDHFRQGDDMAPHHPKDETNAERDSAKAGGKEDAL